MRNFSDFCRSIQQVTLSLTTGAVLAATLSLCSDCTAQGPGSGNAGSTSSVRSTALSNNVLFGTPSNGLFGMDGGSAWVRHIGGGGPGWDPFTSIGISAPRMMDNGALIFEAQGLLTNSGNGGGTFGVNRRFFVGNSLVGTGLWYDVTQAPGETVFHQGAYSVEWFINRQWTVRNNGFIPIGRQSRNVAGSMGMGTGGSVQFQNNNLVAVNLNSLSIVESAMRGIDAEIARTIGNWSGEAFIGFFHLADRAGTNTQGIKGGVRGYVTPRLAGNITISDDPLFGTNVYGGFTWFLGGNGATAPENLRDKLLIPTERGQQVVVNRVSRGVSIPGTVVLTDGGQPITFTHINQNAGGSNVGTFENPFLSLPGTQNTDIVYVHGDGNYLNQSYSLNPNQRFLGEGSGNTHQVFTDQLGTITVPPGNGGANRSIIQAASGQFALNSAANTEISNITIDNTGAGIRSGIFGNNGPVNVNRTLISNGVTGIDITGGTGQFTFADVTVTNTTGAALSVTGGTTDITFDSLSSITQGAGGTAVRVGGGHSGSLLFNGDITSTSGDGLQFDNADGQYDFAGTTLLNGGDAGIDILNGSDGTFTFANPTITNPNAGPAINITGGMAQTTFNGFNVTTTNTTGLFVDSTGTTTINNTVNPADITSTGAPGVDLNNVNVNMALDRITVNNSSAEGIDIDGVSGTFSVRDGDDNADTDITTINGTPNGFAGIDIANSGTATFTFANSDISNTGSHGVRLDNAGTVLFSAANFGTVTDIGTTLINSTNGDAINSTNTNMVVTFARIGETGQILGDGFDITNNDGMTRNVDLIFNNVFGLGVPDPTGAGVRINAQSGTLNARLNANFIATTQQTVVTQDGGNANSLILDLMGNSTLSTFSALPTMQFVGSGTHSTIVRNWTSPNQLIGGVTGSSGILFDRVTFDADANTGNGFQQVQFGTSSLDIGQVPPFTIQRLTGNGLTFINTTGNLNIGTLNIANQTGTGLFVDNSGLGTMFDLSIGGGTIDTIGGDAIILNSVTGFSLNGSTITNAGGFDTIDVTGSNLSGMGNTAGTFSSTDGGGNTGTILFNGGTNTAP